MKWAVILAAIAAAAGGGWFFYARADEGGGAAPALGPRTATIERGPLEVTIEGSGAIEPLFLVEVKSKASGEVLRVAGEAGDRVTRGDLLVELDPRDENRALELSEAELERVQAQEAKARAALAKAKIDTKVAIETAKARVQGARADLESARKRAGRLRDLAAAGDDLASSEEVDLAEAQAALADARLRETQEALEAAEAGPLEIEQRTGDVALAEVDVEKARIALDEQKDRVKDTKILAPLDAVIVGKLVEPGQIIASGISTVSGGTPLLELADTSRLFVSAEIDESDIGRVEVGQPVRVTVEAFADRTFPGEVVRVAPRGEVVQNVTIFRVKIEVTGEEKHLLRLGMTARVQILVAVLEDAVLVPNAALRMDGDRIGVHLAPAAPGAEPEFRAIERGFTDGRVTEARSGLTAGDEVVMPSGAGGEDGDGRRGFNGNVRRAMFMMRGRGGRGH